MFCQCDRQDAIGILSCSYADDLQRHARGRLIRLDRRGLNTMRKRKPEAAEATETLTIEADRDEFDIVPRHPINGPVDDIHSVIRKLMPVLREAIIEATLVPDGATSHNVAEHARLNRIHTALCDLMNAVDGYY
jgi:hypothetical protein